jgi:hypothetical protein
MEGLVGIGETEQVKIMLEFSHDSMDVLPGILMVRFGGGPHELAQTTKVKGELPMKTMAPNAPGIPTSPSLLLTLSMLLTITTFPAGSGLSS